MVLEEVRFPMEHVQNTQPEHWLLLAVFFGIVAICALISKPKSNSQALPCVTLGILAVLFNSFLLLLADRIGYGSYDVLSLVTLQQASIESSFVVIGYCLVVRGFALVARSLFTQNTARAGRTYL
jgi:hypothetical protein